MGKKSSSYILTTTEKKHMKQNKILKMMKTLIIISVIFNIIYFVDIKVPLINPNGSFHGFKSVQGFQGVELPHIGHHSIIKRLFKDNAKYSDFTAIKLDTKNGIYYLVKNNETCRLYGVEGFDFEYCDFELARWEEAKKIVLKYQLEDYDPNKHVDKEGRIQNYNLDYEFYLWLNGSNRYLEIPENVDEIEEYMIELTNLARTK